MTMRTDSGHDDLNSVRHQENLPREFFFSARNAGHEVALCPLSDRTQIVQLERRRVPDRRSAARTIGDEADQIARTNDADQLTVVAYDWHEVDAALDEGARDLAE